MKISVSYTFTASHAVHDDSSYADQHEHRWTLTAHVVGNLVGPGWVMDFARLRSELEMIMELENGATLNDWLGGVPNATVEAIVQEAARHLSRRLPQATQLTCLVLEEDEGCKVHWP